MTRSSIEAERFLLRVKIKGARRLITSESKEHFSMGQNRCAGSSLFPSCLQDRVIEKSIRRTRPKGDGLAPAFWSFFYLHDSNGAQIGLDARKKVQADDAARAFPCC